MGTNKGTPFENRGCSIRVNMGTNKGTPFENKENSLLMIFISIFEIEMIDIYMHIKDNTFINIIRIFKICLETTTFFLAKMQ